MKPTVGRIVHYYNLPMQKGLAAIISHVHSDTCVNLAVFGETGIAFNESRVMLIAEGMSPVGRCCIWPPKV